MHQTYVIPASNLEALQARLAKLDKRASKLKVAGVSIRIETDHVKSHGEFANRPQTVLSRLSVLVGGDQGHDWPASQQKGGAV